MKIKLGTIFLLFSIIILVYQYFFLDNEPSTISPFGPAEGDQIILGVDINDSTKIHNNYDMFNIEGSKHFSTNISLLNQSNVDCEVTVIPILNYELTKVDIALDKGNILSAIDKFNIQVPSKSKANFHISFKKINYNVNDILLLFLPKAILQSNENNNEVTNDDLILTKRIIVYSTSGLPVEFETNSLRIVDIVDEQISNNYSNSFTLGDSLEKVYEVKGSEFNQLRFWLPRTQSQKGTYAIIGVLDLSKVIKISNNFFNTSTGVQGENLPLNYSFEDHYDHNLIILTVKEPYLIGIKELTNELEFVYSMPLKIIASK